MKYCFLFAAIFSFSASAKQITVNQAVGFFFSKQVSHAAIVELCSADHPALKNELEKALATWEKSNERMLLVASEIIDKAKKDVPQTIENIRQAGEKSVQGLYGAMPEDLRLDYCNLNLKNLAGTDWNFDVREPVYFEVVDKYLQSK